MRARASGERSLGLLVVASVAASLGFGCSNRYYVRPNHLARAQQQSVQTGSDVAFPAMTRDREGTYIWVGEIKRYEGIDPTTGLQSVVASDSRGALKVTGWIFTSVGMLFALTALPLSMAPDDATDEAALTTIFLIEAGVHFGVGVPMLVSGYTSDGPEAYRPSPGMPATLADP